MPHYKNNKKNTTRKSNSSTVSQNSSSTPSVSDDDWGSNIKVNTSRQSTPKSKNNSPPPEITTPSPEPQEPPTPEWVTMGISEDEYWKMRHRIQEEMRLYALENFKRNMVNELDSISYWERRLERYERMREPYNKKAGWSAVDISTVDHIDSCIQECLDKIQELQEED